MIKTAAALSLFALIGTGLVAFTQNKTYGKIKAAERKSLLRKLNAVMNPTKYNNNLFTDIITVSSLKYLGTKNPVPVFRARLDGKPAGIIISPVAPDGYNGDIRLLVAVNVEGALEGVRVVNHRETPGLGDAIEARRNDWILGFNDKSLLTPIPEMWRVKRDGGVFDQFTGATITPRAIVKAVLKTLQYVKQNQEMLFRPITPPKAAIAQNQTMNME